MPFAAGKLNLTLLCNPYSSQGTGALHARLAASVAVCLLLSGVLALPSQAEKAGNRACKVMVIGFVGGIGTAHFPPSVAAPLLHHLQSLGYPGVCVKTFSAYCPWCARRWVKKEFAAGSKGRLTEEQIANGPKVIIYGYSLGAPSALYFARQLERDGIPIELAITVDSKGFTRGIIPRNVKVAANFYERQFLLPIFGKRSMQPEDPLATDFLGNIRVAHAGHFKIARSAPVRELLLSTVRAVSYREEKVVAGMDEAAPVTSPPCPSRCRNSICTDRPRADAMPLSCVRSP